MSRNPSVVTSAVLAPLRSMIALVASVVPWMMIDRSPGASPASRNTARIAVDDGALGRLRGGQDLGAEPLARRASSATSVKVPPISTPSLASAFPVMLGLSRGQEAVEHPARPLVEPRVIGAVEHPRRR